MTVCRSVQPTLGIGWIRYCYIPRLLANYSVRAMTVAVVFHHAAKLKNIMQGSMTVIVSVISL